METNEMPKQEEAGPAYGEPAFNENGVPTSPEESMPMENTSESMDQPLENDQPPMDEAPMTQPEPMDEAPMTQPEPMDEPPMNEAPMERTGPTDEPPMNEAPTDEAPTDEPPMDEAAPMEEETSTNNMKTALQEARDALGTATEALSKIESEFATVEAGGSECAEVKKENEDLHTNINMFKDAFSKIQSMGGGRRRTRGRNGRKSRRASKPRGSRKTHRKKSHRRRTHRQNNFLYGF